MCSSDLMPEQIAKIGYWRESAIVRRNDTEALLTGGPKQFKRLVNWQIPFRGGIQHYGETERIQRHGLGIIRHKTDDIGLVGASYK